MRVLNRLPTVPRLRKAARFVFNASAVPATSFLTKPHREPLMILSLSGVRKSYPITERENETLNWISSLQSRMLTMSLWNFF